MFGVVEFVKSFPIIIRKEAGVGPYLKKGFILSHLITTFIVQFIKLKDKAVAKNQVSVKLHFATI